MTDMNDIIIAPLLLEDCSTISFLFQEIGWDKPISLFIEYLAQQQAAKRDIFIAKRQDTIIGYVTIQWNSDHPYFYERNIPEISDLNVLPKYRGKGFGKALLKHAEHEISKCGDIAGIGVGLTADYGPAQVLYVTQGYVPNAEGISYRHKKPTYGDEVIIGDDLALWLTKKLR